MSTLSLDPKTYCVKSGDNLDAIARAQGYRDWQVIYRSKCNQRLRALRSNPNLIRPGDLLILPPRSADIRAALQKRLERLRALRMETDSLFDDLQRQLDSEFKKVENTGAGVDAANDVLNILVGLSRLCWRGYQTLELGAAELSKANRELAKEALDIPKEQFETLTLKAFADQLAQPRTVQLMNSVWMFSVVVVRSWLDVTSPSYWAGVIAELSQGSSVPTALTRRPADIRATASANLAATRRRALEATDGKIRDTQRLLALCSGEISVPLPLL